MGQAAVSTVLIFKTVSGDSDMVLHTLVFADQFGADRRTSSSIAAGLDLLLAAYQPINAILCFIRDAAVGQLLYSPSQSRDQVITFFGPSTFRVEFAR